MGIQGEELKTFLKNPGMDITIFKKRIPSTTLEGKWRNLLLVIHKFSPVKEDLVVCNFTTFV